MKTATIPRPADPTQPPLACVTFEELIALGVSASSVKRKLRSGEWKSWSASPAGKGKRHRLVLLSSLPLALQLGWAQKKFPGENPAEPAVTRGEQLSVVNTSVEKHLARALLHIPPDERILWITEALRLSSLVARYGEISPKRQRDPVTGEYEFAPGVRELCQEAACDDPAILAREPHRARPPSPFTLDGWWRAY